MSELHSSLHTPQLFIRITPTEDVPFQRFTFKSFIYSAFIVFGLNYDLRVVFYVGFRNFRKN